MLLTLLQMSQLKPSLSYKIQKISTNYQERMLLIQSINKSKQKASPLTIEQLAVMQVLMTIP